MDNHGIIQSANPASERMFGYVADEMIGRNVGLIMPSPYREPPSYAPTKPGCERGRSGP
jgi:PAS domain S-box-containing protein